MTRLALLVCALVAAAVAFPSDAKNTDDWKLTDKPHLVDALRAKQLEKVSVTEMLTDKAVIDKLVAVDAKLKKLEQVVDRLFGGTGIGSSNAVAIANAQSTGFGGFFG